MTPSIALVLETNNLKGGGADVATRVASLTKLLAHLRSQTRPLSSLAEVVLTHDGLSDAARESLDLAAGVAIRYVELPPEAGYYAAKNAGFDATKADVVAFGDTDCWPDAQWLEKLTQPFAVADEDAQVVAGRTTYRDDLLGVAATTIDFMYFATPHGDDCTRNFYANNVAFRRETYERFKYVAAGMYRGHCQVVGLALHRAGVPILFEPEARTIHRFPDGAELVNLRLYRGADTVELTRHFSRYLLPPALEAVGRLRPVAPLAVLASRFAFSVRALNQQDLTPVHGLRKVAAVGLIAGITSLDAVGAVLGSLGWKRRKEALSYHADADGLAAAA